MRRFDWIIRGYGRIAMIGLLRMQEGLLKYNTAYDTLKSRSRGWGYMWDRRVCEMEAMV